MKKLKFFVLSILLNGFLLSCTSMKNSTQSENYISGNEQNLLVMQSGTKEKSLQKVESEDRKILYSAFLSLKVEEPDSANAHIEKIAKKYKGYVNEVGTYRTVIRVKSKHLEEAVKEISALGKLQNKNITGQDVTEEYFDYKIRLENAEKARKRYLELLAKAENVEAAVQVEKELERLNEKIELLKGKLKRINHLSEFSTITINLKEKKKPGILGYIGLGLYHSIKWLFVRD